jgi:hypothetical protein
MSAVLDDQKLQTKIIKSKAIASKARSYNSKNKNKIKNQPHLASPSQAKGRNIDDR